MHFKLLVVFVDDFQHWAMCKHVSITLFKGRNPHKLSFTFPGCQLDLNVIDAFVRVEQDIGFGDFRNTM